MPELDCGSLIRTETDSNPSSVAFLCEFEALTRKICFTANVPLQKCSESYVAASMLSFMRDGSGGLGIDGEISRRFLDSLSTIQDIHRSWDGTLQPVEFSGRVNPIVRPKSTEDRVGLFFSGGVDSCYSLLKHQDEITDLIFVRGFDLQPDDRGLCDKVVGRLRDIAEAFDKRFVDVETNIRDIMDPFVDWCAASHGAAMAAVGHLLYPAFRRVYLAAPHTYANLFPCGSHPLVDPLWSTEGLEFVHDGCEATRVEKVARVATSDVLLQNLRVCWKNTNGAYNCGKCEKCLRTMINLYINRALDRCTAFEEPLNLRRVARIEVTKVDTMSYLRENLDALEQSSRDKELQRILRRVIQKPQWWLRFKARCRSSARKLLERSPVWERRVRSFCER